MNEIEGLLLDPPATGKVAAVKGQTGQEVHKIPVSEGHRAPQHQSFGRSQAYGDVGNVPEE